MKSKTCPVFLFMLFFLNPFALLSQTAEVLIEKHITAHGGADAWDKVESLKVTGKFTAFSLENDYTCYKTKEGSFYADLYLGEKKVIEAIHKGEGWTIDPWQEMDYARKLNAGEWNVMMQNAEFITPFFNYREKGHSVEYTGTDTIDGMLMHVLKLTRPSGKTETWYLNAGTYLEYKCESEWVDFGMTVPAESYFDDFRAVDGLLFPFFVERTFWQRDRILLVENIEINAPVDEQLFEMPRRKEMVQLEFLEGVWDVTVEAWTRRGTWYPMGTSTSTFEFISVNMLQEQISYERILPISKTRHYTYNEGGSNYRISEYDDLLTSLTLYEGKLTDTAFIFDDARIRFGEEQPEGMEHTRYILGEIGQDGFILERKGSTDGGNTWNPKDRFTYTRRKM